MPSGGYSNGSKVLMWALTLAQPVWLVLMWAMWQEIGTMNMQLRTIVPRIAVMEERSQFTHTHGPEVPKITIGAREAGNK